MIIEFIIIILRMFMKIIKWLYYRFSTVAFFISGKNFRNKKELNKLKDSCSGKRCFIVCNGPSLRAEDLTILHNNGEISIGMNAIARVYDSTDWRPTYLSLTDGIAFSKLNRRMTSECEAEFKFYDRKFYLRTLGDKGKKLFVKFNESLDLLDNPKFDSDITKKIPSIGTSTYFCIELAVFIGCKEIYLLGCDMSYAVNITRDGKIIFNNSGKEHFYGEREEDLKTSISNPVPVWKLEIAFDTAEQYAKDNGIKIYNVTRGGMLESFERRDFDELFKTIKE